MQALQREISAAKPTAGVEAVLEDYNYEAVAKVASVADVCLVFAQSASGEGYVSPQTWIPSLEATC